MLRQRPFSCTCRLRWCYANYPYLVLVVWDDATPTTFLLYLQTRMMLCERPFSCTCSLRWCYANDHGHYTHLRTWKFTHLHTWEMHSLTHLENHLLTHLGLHSIRKLPANYGITHCRQRDTTPLGSISCCTWCKKSHNTFRDYIYICRKSRDTFRVYILLHLM